MSLLPGLKADAFTEREFYTDELPTGLGSYLGARLALGFESSLAGRLADALAEPAPIQDSFVDPGTGTSYPLPQGSAVQGFGPAGEKPLTEEGFRTSRFWRGEDGPAFEPGMGAELARSRAEDWDRRRWRETLVARYRGGLGGQALGLGAALLGGAASPESFLPVLGPAAKAAAVARLGFYGGRIATAAAKGAIGNALVDTAVLPDLARRGEDAGVEDFALDVFGGAIIGGVLAGGVGGAVAKVLDRRREAREAAVQALEAKTRVENIQARLDAANLAIDQMAAGEAIDVGMVIRGETGRLSKVYDQVLARPVGPADDPMVELRPEDLERVLVERGPVRERDGEIQVSWKGQRGYGVAKVIWQHGERSIKDPEFRVTRDDVLALPEVLRSLEPSSVGSSGKMEWRVDLPAENGRMRQVVYGLSPLPEGGGQRLATIYVQEPDRSGAGSPGSPRRAGLDPRSKVGSPLPGYAPDGLPLAIPEARNPPAPGFPDRLSRTAGNTAAGPFDKPAQGQERAAARNTMRPGTRPVNFDRVAREPEPHPSVAEPADRPSIAEAAPRVGRPPRSKAEELKQLREDMGLGTAEDGRTPEREDLDRLRKDGRLTAGDERALADAEGEAKLAEAWAEGYESLVGCSLRYAV